MSNPIDRRNFLKQASVAGIGLSLAGYFSPSARANTQMNHNVLKKAAQRTYEDLKHVFQKSRDYWKLGHTFDTIIDYFIVTDGGDGEAAVFGKLALERYTASHGSWYDDYAWWAIANLKAAQHQHLFGDDTAKFYDNCIQDWHKMAPAATTWDLAQNNPKFRALKPAIAGGVWNHTYDFGDNAGYNPLNPKGDALGGYQNTVTNGLYLVLAARLARHTGQTDKIDNPYRAAMEREYKFLQSWFTLSRPGVEPLLTFYSDDKSKAVVRERISSYVSGLKVHGYRSDLAWAGDQGLIIGGLVERMEIVKKGDPTYSAMLAVTRQILAGVREYLAVDGRLLAWWPDPPPGYCLRRPAGDPEDYRTGVAVYMRYLLYVYLLNNEDLRPDLLPYTGFVHTNARQAMQYPSLTDGRVDSTMIALANDLAVLTAAIVIA